MATMPINATRESGPTALRARLTVVPWSTVLPIAVLLAYADGFWMISLRGSVGSIERTQEPTATWLRESTLALPVFVLAVLAALVLAARWFGPALRRPKTILATALMIVAAGTLVGTAEVAVSSAYDYHLQSAQLQLMGSMASTPASPSTPSMPSMGSMSSSASTGPSASTAHEQQASLGLQVRAVAYGSGLLLVTNLVLVGWLVAMRGGRLEVNKTRE